MTRGSCASPVVLAQGQVTGTPSHGRSPVAASVIREYDTPYARVALVKVRLQGVAVEALNGVTSAQVLINDMPFEQGAVELPLEDCRAVGRTRHHSVAVEIGGELQFLHDAEDGHRVASSHPDAGTWTEDQQASDLHLDKQRHVL